MNAFNPETITLTFRRKPGFLSLSSDKVYITQIKDTQTGLKVLEALKDAINSTWEHCHELNAVTKDRRSPCHLDIWELLPRTNCKQCGEASCLAFAVVFAFWDHPGFISTALTFGQKSGWFMR